MGAPRAPAKRRGFTRRRFVPAAPAVVAMLAARAALDGYGDPIEGDDAIALREQLRAEDEARRCKQGELAFAAKGRG